MLASNLESVRLLNKRQQLRAPIGARVEIGHQRGKPRADRPKKVLMHRRELDRLAGQLQLKGHTLVPLKLYLARGKIKLELGLGKGKLLFDKRETLRRKTDEREAAREMRR